jgi:hypothetical protein
VDGDTSVRSTPAQKHNPSSGPTVEAALLLI